MGGYDYSDEGYDDSPNHEPNEREGYYLKELPHHSSSGEYEKDEAPSDSSYNDNDWASERS